MYAVAGQSAVNAERQRPVGASPLRQRLVLGCFILHAAIESGLRRKR